MLYYFTTLVLFRGRKPVLFEFEVLLKNVLAIAFENR